MKILKIFGVVMAIHGFAFMLIFANPGCSSTQRPQGPTVADAEPATNESAPSVSAVSAVPAGANAPAISFDPNAPAINAPTSANNTVRFTPTRPNTPAANVVQAAPVPDVTPATTYTVTRNDSLWAIAKKHNLRVSDLTAANNISANANLQPGQKLIIPGKAQAKSGPAPSDGPTYTVKSGDTLAVIAARHRTTVAALREINHLRGDIVRLGQELKLPPEASSISSGPSSSSPPTSAPSSPAKSSDATSHVVKNGESLISIARKYGVRASDLGAANNISDPGRIYSGMTLVIPISATKRPAATPPPPSVTPESTPTPESVPTIAIPEAPPKSEIPEIPVISVEEAPANPPKG